MSTRSAHNTLVTRPPRTIPVWILAVALLAAGGLGIWLLGTFLVEDTWPAPASGTLATISEYTLDSLPVRLTAIALAVAGLAMLLAALVPGRPARVSALADDVPGHTAISRKDLARRIQRRTENVDGVHSAAVSVRRRRIDVMVDTVVDDPAPVTRGATAAVEQALAELRPATPSRHRVRTHRRS